ncbi:cell division protein FtsQ/DivIB [Merismopedia glauca]|uniref:Cell division protein FtsQ n=1 Tax=Merismopedia glauca CCAP 1448/3 TaxID=1296344 RepID=A0A2T1C3S9_9CYAN|nr:FtsQ-type POTRA domain-containing protein [Merismopedia glauca]PSB02874.1 cell division protein FtsQ [Merismopedia glauca CCAP 1448/3]
MNEIVRISPAYLQKRRRHLRHQRRIKLTQFFWRLTLVSGILGGVVWVAQRSDWVVRSPEQIEIRGNRLLSLNSLRSTLPISYPQSLLQVQPQVITKELNSNPAIAKATVNRTLWPPKIQIEIQERQPVALVPLQQKVAGRHQIIPGLLDRQGNWIPLSSYQSATTAFKVPQLEVTGYDNMYRPYWSQVYQKLSASPVKIRQLNWSDPVNLVLQTEIGTVHLGPYTDKFTEQLKVLDRMRQLPNQIQRDRLAYIDLTDPASPSIQLRSSPESAATNSP